MAEIVNMPKLGFDMAEGTLVRWVIQEGEPVGKGTVLAEIETDKATVEVESTYEGIVAQHLVQTGEVVPVNTPIAVIAAPGEKVDLATVGKPAKKIRVPEPIEIESVTAAPAKTVGPVEGRLPGDVKASPLARRMASEVGINLQQVPGTGPGGRIVKRDIKAFMMAPAAAKPASPAAPSVQPAAQPSPALPPAVTPLAPLSPVSEISAPADKLLPPNRLRAAIGRRMTESKQQLPHFYVTHEYDLAALLSLRQQINALLPEEEKISINDFIVKAVALTLRQFPNLNASLSDNQVVHHGAVNVGVAVAVDGGLLTVVCRDTDRKSLRQIAVEVRAMAARAREGKVRPDDIEGSTLSVSNLGMFDVEHFIAIINPPEAAILAVGSAREVPVIQGGQVVPGWRMKATISVDHRISDGAEAARFLQALALYLEEPLRLML